MNDQHRPPKIQTVAISAVSSFTGAWIARDLAVSGFSVKGLLTKKKLEQYSPLQRTRFELIAHAVNNLSIEFGGNDNHFDFAYEVDCENQSMPDWLKANRPQVWIHHHHFMESFRSSDYNLTRALQMGIDPLPDLFESLASADCKLVIFSSTYFEPHEGNRIDPIAATPYAQSKSKVWNEVSRLCKIHELSVARIVIPNPIGAMENMDRLIPALIKSGMERKPFNLTTPSSRADNIPVANLAQVYCLAIEDFIKAKSQHPETRFSKEYRPTTGSQTNKWLVDQVIEHLFPKLKLPEIEIQLPKDEPPPSHFENLGPAPNSSQLIEVDWPKFWTEYAQIAAQYKLF